MANSFQHQPGEVAFKAYRADDVMEAMTAAESLAWQRVGALLEVPGPDRTFDNTVLALADATEELSSVRALVNHLAQVQGGPWHPVNEVATEREAKVGNELRFHQGIYRALLEVRDRPGYIASLSPPRQKYLNELVLGYERDGIALGEDQQRELKAIAAQLSTEEVAFTRNVIEASDAAGLWVADEAQLEGLSDEFVQKCRAAAQERGQDGYWVTYNSPNYRYVIGNCGDRATRQALYRTHISLAAGQNVRIAQEILALRRRQAEILGYRDYADYALELRMARDGATAAGFITELTEQYRPTAQTEHEELVSFARQLESDPALELDAADVGVDTYYAAQLRASQVGLKEEELRDYLTLPGVRDTLFSTLGALYGLRFQPVTAESWHDEVEVYEIWDQDKHLSTVWCDWYARKGKVAGAWADAFYVAPRAGGHVGRAMLGCVVCNFPPPDASGHSRLSVHDVETLWHEFGHFVHLTANMTELRQHSPFACRWDFIEAPSQIMENWVWEPEVLSRMAVHYRTGEGLSTGVTARLVESRRFRAATAAMRQFALAALDLALHRQYRGATPGELLSYSRASRAEFLPVGPYPEEASVASFKHIFGDHYYASAYYSYKWAEAIEADLFSAFKPDKLSSPEVGSRYREQVLARGAEVEPAELVNLFLGRASTPEAMLRRDGIRPATTAAG